MKRILVPCDFSIQARNAFQTAISISSAEKTEVHLLHVIEIPVLQDPLLMPVPAFEDGLFGEMEGKAKEQFKKLCSDTPQNITIVSRVLYGATSTMIKDYIKDQNIELVVMGTRGASGLREVLIGSNTEKIVRQSQVPVLVVRDAVQKSAVKDIVFPNALDMENQERLIMQVKSLQEFFKARLHIVWINTPSHFVPDKQTKQRLDHFVKRYMFSNYTINIYNDIYEESGIINFSHDINASMLVMGTHGRKGISHIFSGSVTEDVVNHIDLPIWTFSLN